MFSYRFLMHFGSMLATNVEPIWTENVCTNTFMNVLYGKVPPSPCRLWGWCPPCARSGPSMQRSTFCGWLSPRWDHPRVLELQVHPRCAQESFLLEVFLARRGNAEYLTGGSSPRHLCGDVHCFRQLIPTCSILSSLTKSRHCEFLRHA